MSSQLPTATAMTLMPARRVRSACSCVAAGCHELPLVMTIAIREMPARADVNALVRTYHSAADVFVLTTYHTVVSLDIQ